MQEEGESAAALGQSQTNTRIAANRCFGREAALREKRGGLADAEAQTGSFLAFLRHFRRFALLCRNFFLHFLRAAAR